MKQKILALLLVLLFTTSIIAGCQSNDNANEVTDGVATGDVKDDNNTSQEEVEKIVYAFPLLSNEPADLLEVQDAINAISIPKINVEVELLPIDKH